jgi:general secretion pathway protein B
MSYILDALRKSDQQRQRGTTPITLTTRAPELTPKTVPLPLWAALAVVLIGAGMLIGWWRPWQVGTPAPAPRVLPERPVLVAAPVAPVVPAYTPSTPSMAVASRSTVETPGGHEMPSGAGETPVAAESVTLRIAGGTPTVPETPPPRNAGGTPALPPNPPAASAGKVVEQRELPASIQQEIPNIVISMHGYASNPGDRLTMLNDRLMRQGDQLAPGLRLELITPDGVVLDYKGYRFHHSVR